MKFFRTDRSILERHERTLAVELGQVVCPRRGIVDIEDCWICPAYRGFSGEPTERMICSTAPAILPFAGRTAIQS